MATIPSKSGKLVAYITQDRYLRVKRTKVEEQRIA
jgi:hypothetical protein